MKTFKKPLSAEEEARYVRALQEGSREEAAKAKEVLIEHNLRLVAVFNRPWNIHEELPDGRFVRCAGWKEIERIFEG